MIKVRITGWNRRFPVPNTVLLNKQGIEILTAIKASNDCSENELEVTNGDLALRTNFFFLI